MRLGVVDDDGNITPAVRGECRLDVVAVGRGDTAQRWPAIRVDVPDEVSVGIMGSVEAMSWAMAYEFYLRVDVKAGGTYFVGPKDLKNVIAIGRVDGVPHYILLPDEWCREKFRYRAAEISRSAALQ